MLISSRNRINNTAVLTALFLLIWFLRKTIIGSVILAYACGHIAFIFGEFFLDFAINRPPTSMAMVEKFEKHREEFDKLQKMIAADSELDLFGFKPYRMGYIQWFVVDMIDPAYYITVNGKTYEFSTIPENYLKAGVDKERIREYIDLLVQIGATHIISYSFSESDQFGVYSRSFFLNFSYRGYCYRDEPPEKVVVDIDEASPYGEVFQHLEGNWYIYQEGG
jgi:hypothetical protein